VLEAVALHLQDLLPLFFSAYAAPSFIFFGKYTVSSEEGVQQGDPLGPFFFVFLSTASCSFERVAW